MTAIPILTHDFDTMLRDKAAAESFINTLADALPQSGWWGWLIGEYERESAGDPTRAYPSQGLIATPYDHPLDPMSTRIDEPTFHGIMLAWLYYLHVFNHPQRVEALFALKESAFMPPQPMTHPLFERAEAEARAIAINELALDVQGADKPRTKRTERFMQGPFVMLGKQPRSIFVGSANPDVWGSAPAIASMVMSHCLCGLPRDGFFTDIERQAALATRVFEWLERSPVLMTNPNNRDRLLAYWKTNLMGVLETSRGKAIRRAERLYEVGVRTFRIYSPEPGSSLLETLIAMREWEAQEHLEALEIFAGQVVAVDQAEQLQAAGADGLFVGIGGGGRCTTGVRSGAAINWPQLVWRMRSSGKISLPVIVEGGASDHIAQTLALGATGIGVTRAVGGGTIESPGGLAYFIDEERNKFKFYRGEASAGMKYMGGREGPFGIIPYVEGESTKAYMEFGRGNLPTLLQKLFLLFGDAVLAMVFQNQESIPEFQNAAAGVLRGVSPAEEELRNTH
jgi:hypothetical protein